MQTARPCRNLFDNIPYTSFYVYRTIHNRDGNSQHAGRAKIHLKNKSLEINIANLNRNNNITEFYAARFFGFCFFAADFRLSLRFSIPFVKSLCSRISPISGGLSLRSVVRSGTERSSFLLCCEQRSVTLVRIAASPLNLCPVRFASVR